jgi:predicted CXXCH cytochrome family protein
MARGLDETAPHGGQRMKKRLTILCVAALLATVFSGCEAHSRYRMLCFLFDGVPVPQGEVPCDENGKPLPPGKRNNKGATSQVARKYAQHGPYAARLCEGCHQRQTNKLLLPVNDLCTYCHVLSTKKKRIHGPVAAGGCAICHDAHGSGNEYLLVSKSEDFCLHCHRREDVLNNVVHQAPDASNCSTCHNAHASDNDYLLRDAPGSSNEESPWGAPKQKPLEHNLATTAMADDVPGRNNAAGPGEPKQRSVRRQGAGDSTMTEQN